MEFKQYSDTIELISEQQNNEDFWVSDIEEAPRIFSRKKRSYTIEQMTAEENFSEQMKKLEYSNLDGNNQSGFTPFHHAAKEIT